MADFLFQAWQDMQLAFERAVQWVTSLRYDPRLWDTNTWLLVVGAVLLLIAILVSGGRRRRASKGPQFLLTNGQIVLLDGPHPAAPANGGTRRPALLQAPPDSEYQLRVTVNNLNSYPVQLLEIAVRTSAGKLPVVADASAVVPPNGAVDVVADIVDLPGERGTLELYLYNTKVAPRSLRLVVPIDWEPWNQRYRVRATAQRLDPTREVASEARQRQEKAAVRRGRMKEFVGSTTQGIAERAGEVRRDLAARRKRAAKERRLRSEAEREAGERRRGEHQEGTFSVPLAPSPGRRAGDRVADDPGVWPEPEATGPESTAGSATERASEQRLAPQDGRDQPQNEPRDKPRDEPRRLRDEPGEPSETRTPEDIEVSDREPEPPRRLEFPDDF